MSEGSEFDADLIDEANKAEWIASLLVGIRDQELVDLQNEFDKISLENYAANIHIEGFKKEIKKLDDSIKENLEDFEKSLKRKEESAKEAELLKQLYAKLKAEQKTKPRKSAASEMYREQILSAQQTYPQRVEEYVQHKKEFDAAHPKAKEIENQAKLADSKAELAAVVEAFKVAQQSEKELDEQLSELEKQGQLRVKELEEELAEVEKLLATRSDLKNGNTETRLVNEIEALKRHPDMIINSDDSSVESSLNEAAPATIVFQKMTTDLDLFFKNPNDFPNMRSPSTSKKPPTSSAKNAKSADSNAPVSAKRARVEIGRKTEPRPEPQILSKLSSKPIKSSAAQKSMSASSESSSPSHKKQKIVSSTQTLKDLTSARKPQNVSEPPKVPVHRRMTISRKDSSAGWKVQSYSKSASPVINTVNSAVKKVDEATNAKEAAAEKSKENSDNVSLPETPEDENDCEDQVEEENVVDQENLGEKEDDFSWDQSCKSRGSNPDMETFVDNSLDNSFNIDFEDGAEVDLNSSFAGDAAVGEDDPWNFLGNFSGTTEEANLEEAGLDFSSVDGEDAASVEGSIF